LNISVNYTYNNSKFDLHNHDSSIDKNHKVTSGDTGVKIFNSRIVIEATINF